MILNIILGFFMALADSVPGVSGGTVAFLLGFYDEFINSLNYLIKGCKEERIKAIKFLIKLLIGWVVGMTLAVSILANVFDEGIYKISSLFLGLVITSIPIMIIEEKKNLINKKNMLFMIPGILLVVVLSIIKVTKGLDLQNLNLGMIIYIMISGMLAISAMVLPGISGSTLLLSFGLYIPIITAIKNLLHFDFSGFSLLLIFGIGVLLGIFVSIRGIKKVLEKYRSQTLYVIIGMMIGSLYAIIVGPTTLKVPKEAMNFSNFSIVYFLIGILIVFGLQKMKSLPFYKKELKK